MEESNATEEQHATNSGVIKCKHCPSVILQPNTASRVKVEKGINLPGFGTAQAEGEKFFSFWTVSDMFAFENVGFCNTVNNIKYLACADCEIGPIGAHFIDNKKAFYIAPERVEHIVS